MALTVTPGDASADAYISEADADTYLAGRGDAAWAGRTASEKEIAIRNATEWLDATYGHMFAGARTNGANQALVWPRTGATTYEGYAIDSATIPVQIERATAVAASLEAATPGSLVASAGEDQVEKEERIKVGPIEVELAEGSSSSSKGQVFLGPKAVELLLVGLLGPRTGYFPTGIMHTT